MFGLIFKRNWALKQKIELFITFFRLIFKIKWDFVSIEESVREPNFKWYFEEKFEVPTTFFWLDF